MSSNFLFFGLPGAGFLLQAEGARLPDEERAGSFGNHPAEPALVGQEPGLSTELALTPPGLRSIHRCLHYSRTVSLLAGQSTHPRLEGCALPCWTRCRMVWRWSCKLYLLAQGGSDLCLRHGRFKKNHTPHTLHCWPNCFSEAPTSPPVSSEDNQAWHALLPAQPALLQPF